MINCQVCDTDNKYITSEGDIPSQKINYRYVPHKARIKPQSDCNFSTVNASLCRTKNKSVLPECGRDLWLASKQQNRTKVRDIISRPVSCHRRCCVVPGLRSPWLALQKQAAMLQAQGAGPWPETRAVSPCWGWPPTKGPHSVSQQMVQHAKWGCKERLQMRTELWPAHRLRPCRGHSVPTEASIQ